MEESSSEYIKPLSSCSVGFALGEECHKSYHVSKGKAGLLNISNLSDDDRDLLKMRINVSDLQNETTICFHHEKKYLSRYSSIYKYCADPKQQHKSRITRKLVKYIFFIHVKYS